MKVPGVKYMRDFYPEEMRARQWIEDAWRRASEQAGFSPWDAPIVEHLDLYRRKSGDEIVGQLYTLTDQGERELAIRPEMTPSLARMIAERQAALPRPIKWYCIARMCRYERGQRGRLREFWQWNIDVLGVQGASADAEVISVALDGLRLLGLTAEHVLVRLSSRTLLASILESLGVPETNRPAIYAATDKRGKVPPAGLRELYEKAGFAPQALDTFLGIMDQTSIDDLSRVIEEKELRGCDGPLAELRQLVDYLDALGKREYVRLDLGIVRGLAYYTGPVFEIFDRGSTLRALAGGGRYDRLMETMGGQAMPACGFGMGDVVLSELLKDLKKLTPPSAHLDSYLIASDDSSLRVALDLARRLRERGERVDYAMKAGAAQKAIKRALELGARRAIVLSSNEGVTTTARVRDLTNATERDVPIGDI